MEIQTIGAFLSYYEPVRERPLRVVRLVPPDKLEWRHAPAVFSSGDLARHIAAVERYTFTENVFGRPSRYRGCGPALAVEGHPVTRWKLLRAMIEHEVHQRGELYVYLALLGVPRLPLFGVTEPEV